MAYLKNIIKKNFTAFTFFYREIGDKLFLLLMLSLLTSVLDGFGLTMFLPLLQIAGGVENIDADQLGSMNFIVKWFEMMGLNLTVFTVLLFMVFFFFTKGITVYLNQIYNVFVQHAFIRNLRLKLLKSLDLMKFKDFVSADAGRIQNTFSGEVDRVSLGFQNYFAAFQQGIMVLVYLFFAFFIDWKFALLVGVGGIITNFLFSIIYRKTKDASVDLTRTGHTYQGYILQHVSNFKYLKATGRIGKHSHKLQETIYLIEKIRRRMGVLAGISASAREPILILLVVVVIAVQIKFLGGSIGPILISLLFFYRSLASLLSLQQSWNNYLQVSGSLQNMQNFQNELNSSLEISGNKLFSGLDKEIKCENLSFSYDKKLILNNINLSIKKNTSVALVGESGSGKTTLVNILAGLLDVTEGDVTLDSTSLNSLLKSSLQQKIGYITQEPVIFNDTVYNNVSFWAERTEENLKKFEIAMEKAALTDFLTSVTNGKDTILGNNGINLSGGQKQRISIARELFRDIEILIMDEATSALDSETEFAIQQSIDGLAGSYTIIIVAHRLATIRNVDLIVFLRNGTIEQQGTFEHLVTVVPDFKKMVELQKL